MHEVLSRRKLLWWNPSHCGYLHNPAIAGLWTLCQDSPSSGMYPLTWNFPLFNFTLALHLLSYLVLTYIQFIAWYLNGRSYSRTFSLYLFSDADSQERHHDYLTMGFFCEKGFVLHKLEEKAPAFYARLIEFRSLSLIEAPPNVPLIGCGSSTSFAYREMGRPSSHHRH